MTTDQIVEQDRFGAADSATDEQLIARLVDQARGDGLKLTGEGGLLQKLTKRLLESALEGEITDHVGYDKHDAQSRVDGTLGANPADSPRRVGMSEGQSCNY